MKQNSLLILLPLFFLFSHTAIAQAIVSVQNGNNFEWFQRTNGLYFYDQGNGLPGLEVPAFSSNSSLFTASFWIGGINENDELKIRFSRYCQDSLETCFENWGPIKTNGSLASSEEVESYNDVWFISGFSIIQHLNYYDCLNDPLCDTQEEFPNYSIPSDFLSWPAQSDPGSGFSEYLAPFFDYNGDGNYNPEDGDHPAICGDFASYMIHNGRGTENTEQWGHELDVEIHTMIYGYSGGEESLFNTLFVQHKAINRGTETLNNSLMGIWTDFDLGNPTDDFVGTEVSRSMVYALNADVFDESHFAGPGYGSDLPMMGVKVLAGPFKDANGTDDQPEYESLYGNETIGYNDGIIDNERLGLSSSMYVNNVTVPGPVATYDPQAPVEHYQFMRSIWRDGTALEFGGTGYSPTNEASTIAKYVFPGESDPLYAGTEGQEPIPNYPFEGGWTEENEGNAPGDRRMIGSSGPFTFAPGDVQYIDLAYIFARESHDPEETVFETLQRYADEVEGMQCDPLPQIVLANESQVEPKALNVYPNPAQHEIAFDLPLAHASMTILDITGKEIRQAQLQGGNQRIDIEKLGSGVYLIRIATANSIYHGKFVVEK
ncbi:MAG TPA: T9SS type A sorting domain-containing protein [Cryomorphaceae bacterium]|nr:T9SS type A sorting domain-containing protein [Cryomorphaceae bacterium]